MMHRHVVAGLVLLTVSLASAQGSGRVGVGVVVPITRPYTPYYAPYYGPYPTYGYYVPYYPPYGAGYAVPPAVYVQPGQIYGQPVPFQIYGQPAPGLSYGQPAAPLPPPLPPVGPQP